MRHLRLSKRLLMLAALAVGVTLANLRPASAQWTVVDFESVPLISGYQELTSTGYAGLNWYPASAGTTWSASNVTGYTTPHSGAKYAFNDWWGNNAGFSWASPVEFHGAWFASTTSGQAASDVRFWDGGTRYTSWMALSSTPGFLTADWLNTSVVFVQPRQGAVESMGNYGMDDLAYAIPAPPSGNTPEPASLALLGTGLALPAIRKRRRRRAV